MYFALCIQLVVIMSKCFVVALFGSLGWLQTYKINQNKLRKITDTGEKAYTNFHLQFFTKILF